MPSLATYATNYSIDTQEDSDKASRDKRTETLIGY